MHTNRTGFVLMLFVLLYAMDIRLEANAAGAQRPNIVLIMADDAGVECFGSYGGQSYRTPHIDRLAKEGLRFSHCFSQPLCTPSRVKLMTGLSNIRNYSHFSILEPDQKTFGHMLQSAGYRTCVIGKWQLYGSDGYGKLAGTGMRPEDAGFDEYCLWQIDKRQKRYWDPVLVQNGEYLTDMHGKYGPDVFWQYAEEFLERNKDRPFFLYYPMCLPHDPFLPTPDSKDRDSIDKAQNFADMIAYTDKQVGRIVDKLDSLGIDKNTLMLFTCDNGTHRSITSKRNGKQAKGGKGMPTLAGTHVPLVARWQGVMQPGRTCNDLIDFSDFLPTIAEVCEVAVPAGVVPDGRSFLPQLKGEPGHPREWVYCYYYPRPGNNRMPERRFAHNHRHKLYSDGRFYDMQADRQELTPLTAAQLNDAATATRAVLTKAIASFPKEPARIQE